MPAHQLTLNGTELAVEYAPGAGSPVVLLHGFGLDRRMWEPQWQAWQGGFPVLRYDVRGFGESATPAVAPYSHEEDLAALLDWAGAPAAHLVGHSMGGRLALRFAVTFPERVASLVLADSALDGHVFSAEWSRRWTDLVTLARSGRLADARQAWLDHPLFAPARRHPAVGARLAGMVRTYSGWHWLHRDPASVPVPPVADRLVDILAPALVLWGDSDLPDFHVVARRLVRELPRVEGREIAASGHLTNLEAPDEFTALATAFLLSHGAGRGTRHV